MRAPRRKGIHQETRSVRNKKIRTLPRKRKRRRMGTMQNSELFQECRLRKHLHPAEDKMMACLWCMMLSPKLEFKTDEIKSREGESNKIETKEKQFDALGRRKYLKSPPLLLLMADADAMLTDFVSFCSLLYLLIVQIVNADQQTSDAYVDQQHSEVER